MKKQIMITAIMSIAIAMAGCGSVNGTGPVNNVSTTTTATVSAAESSSDESSSVKDTADSKPSESKPDDEKKADKNAEKKSDESKADSTAETPAPQGKVAANADVSEILGEWVEMGNREAHFITVNSDGSFEAFTNNGTIASGNVAVDTVNGVKQYSFNNTGDEFRYAPFVYSCENGFETIATIDYPAFGSVSYCRKTEDIYPSPVYGDILGTWYEEDADMGRSFTVDNDGRYVLDLGNGSTSTGTIAAQSTDDNQVLYIFYDNYPGIWYTFMYNDGSFPELISYKTDVNDTMIAFSREPSSLSSSEALGKIVGTWYGDDPNYPALVINADGSYTMLADDGSVEKTNLVKVEIRNGVEKYTFKDDMLGTWLVPFELRGDVLVTEDNPVYGTLYFTR